ncbi:hypothetical protein KKH82_00025 [Patescibacteria group bacterium]|nr:hypothetical protein [Patescibacteria group bacterium]
MDVIEEVSQEVQENLANEAYNNSLNERLDVPTQEGSVVYKKEGVNQDDIVDIKDITKKNADMEVL